MVYYDSMRLVLPDYYFPARAVVNMMALKFKYNSDDNIITNTDVQYMTPHTYTTLVSVIINTYMKILQKKSKMLLQYLFGQTVVYTGHMLIRYTCEINR